MAVVIRVIWSRCFGGISDGTDGKATRAARCSLGRASVWFTNAGWASIWVARDRRARTGMTDRLVASAGMQEWLAARASV